MYIATRTIKGLKMAKVKPCIDNNVFKFNLLAIKRQGKRKAPISESQTAPKFNGIREYKIASKYIRIRLFGWRELAPLIALWWDADGNHIHLVKRGIWNQRIAMKNTNGIRGFSNEIQCILNGSSQG